jgi:DMSO/TMAO reductase YedYZ molybdopterin-dependent catalytic subunit
MNSILSRRHLLSTSMAALALSQLSHRAFGFADPAGDEELVPFLDAQPDMKGKAIQWDQLKDWLTPTGQIFAVSHYGAAQVPLESWKLEFTGLFEKPLSLTLANLKARPTKEITATIECSGNGASANFMGAVANAKWAGVPLAPLLKEAGIKSAAVELAFWAADKGKEKIKNNEVEQNFARTLSIADATRDDILLCHTLNGQPLPQSHGAPVRLIVPGYYGIAWVKWLTRIEARERRLMNRFTARDYVTLRGEKQGEQVVWKESSVGPMNPKSIVARVVKRKDGTLVISGAAWSQESIKSVELQIDNRPWVTVDLTPNDQPHTWTFFHHEWKSPAPGQHTLVSRAIDSQGRVQPSPEDPAIKLKKTYYEANQQVQRNIRV